MMCYDAIKLSHGENQSNLNLPNQNYYKKLMIFRQNKVGVPAPLLYDIVNNGIQITDPVYIQGNGFTDILKNVWNWFKPRSESIIAAAKR
ncbi:hypothetical protein PAPYR_9523 [Paratrimastix pyriformis]|uniref:Uncharacterized protein n=1 Tax=Paratrimastix pyriformis TaxID=342808 RepID=A0ABQ8U537_9EUKA|nr:hypothetical protein PAPYR_10825 [Paratrimastix pyriformis]KAJ4455532.1 hypothetical protein PAPYR_9523 [Paratrimastix pyriformis]